MIKDGFEPLIWFCQPVANGIWAIEAHNSFGAYTPCAIDSLVISISHLVLMGLCLFRVLLIKNHTKAQRFCLRSNCYNYIMGLLAGCCVAEPLLRLIMGISIFNLDGETRLAPFEATSFIIEALAWCSMVIMIGLETKNLPQGVPSVLYLYISMVLCEALFGVLLLVHVPNLNLYVGYLIMQNEFPDNVDYEAHSVDEQICPERQANIFSRIYFGWITPLMQKGYRRPITEKDVWKLDTWDQTETLMKKFQRIWAEETQRKKPWLLRALNNSLGVRFWLGGLFKIGFDLSLFVGPLLLNHLLKSMEQGDPACIGYIYAFLFFVGVVCFLSSQDYQNVYRVGFRLQSTLVAAIFQKSLRLTHEARKNFHSGRITNMITTDPSAVEQMCQPLHGLWSAPFRIIMSMVLLYQQLGVASLLGALILVLMVPAQERKVLA
ncbi:hypothetical protein SLA2020_374530 [Shorea laevis]